MRLFIAATFPRDVLQTLDERVQQVKPKLPPASWVKPGSQHLTFAFLGEQDASVVDRIAIEDGPRFDESLRGGGFFPNRRNARAGWVGVDPEKKFVELAGRVRSALAGIEFDDKPFKPHLTLMRIRDRWPPRATETFENAFRDYSSVPFAVAGVTLYSSRLNATGAIHTALRTFALHAG